ncbi:efflux RND transporter periplasmic adaptor subunit [Candidatus Pollutiaquabacter sp.]|uniref:efflux RND transporter periplasmic adaptor subunit n=1 Tax=Candidatus Pollutiaquabacter sp. TaxID=3416354 RepID=UPI003C980A9E|nr:efflux RND transporter periplasmic adaptor subunit [Bacteroidota bacterium]
MKQILISTILFSILIVSGCKNGHENHQAISGSYYTCPMHPSVVSSTPGSCPVCNMSLIKVEKNENEHAGHQGNFITIDKRKQELAGIKTDTVKLRNITSASTIIGTVAIDDEQVKTISSRAKGRIDKLFIKNTGAFIKSGEPLYSIYSEQLQADEKEYLSLFEKSKTVNATTQLTKELAGAAKNKLLLWGLSEKQIFDLEKSGNASPLITFYSPEAGYVTEVNITEGMYVQEGSSLLKITSLNQVWVEAQLYSNEVSGIAENKSFKVFSESNPEQIYTGKLAYSNPVIEEGKRIYLLKIRVNNPKGNLIPGTLVSVVPEKSSASVLAVPKSSVLLEKMKTVWVLAHENTFEQRMVVTGAENKYWIEITSGLKQGDVVVTEGAYLISSEFILKSGAGQRHEH